MSTERTRRSNMRRSEFVFAYGSNMDPAQMRERCPESDLSWFVAEARGWKLSFPRKSTKRKGGVGSIRKHKTQSVWGVVFSVTSRDLDRLDSFEGVPKSYYRNHIDVVDKQGRFYKVWTYFARPMAGRHYPHKDYIALYVRGATYFGLPKQYVSRLKRMERDARRRGRDR